MIGYFYYLAFRRQLAWRSASLAAFLGLSAHALSVATRGFAAGRVPWGNMYEYSSMIALLVVLGYVLVIDRRFHLREIGVFAMAAAVVTMAFARQLYAPAGPLVPALNSIW